MTCEYSPPKVFEFSPEASEQVVYLSGPNPVKVIKEAED